MHSTTIPDTITFKKIHCAEHSYYHRFPGNWSTGQTTFIGFSRRIGHFLALDIHINYIVTMTKNPIIVPKPLVEPISDSLSDPVDLSIDQENLTDEQFRQYIAQRRLDAMPDPSLIDPGALTRKQPDDIFRHIGITLLFSDREHGTLQAVQEKRDDVSYSHTIRSLIAEEAKRIWPQGITDEQIQKVVKRKTDLRQRMRLESAEKRESKLAAKAKAAQEKLLVAREVVRRVKKPTKPVSLKEAIYRAICDAKRKKKRQLTMAEATEIEERVRGERENRS